MCTTLFWNNITNITEHIGDVKFREFFVRISVLLFVFAFIYKIKFVEEDINWEQVWSKLKQIHVSNKIKEFQWKCIHNIIYTEYRLQIMNISNGKCNLAVLAYGV